MEQHSSSDPPAETLTLDRVYMQQRDRVMNGSNWKIGLVSTNLHSMRSLHDYARVHVNVFNS